MKLRTLFNILLLLGLTQASFGNSYVLDKRTFTEKLFNGGMKGWTVFTCKIIMPIKVNESKPEIKNTNNYVTTIEPNIPHKILAKAEVIHVYFGKIDTNIVILKTEVYSSFEFPTGKTFMIYTNGNGKSLNYNNIEVGGNYKQVTEIPESTNEVLLLKQFSDIFKNRTTGKFTFKSEKNIILATGSFKKGKAIGIWKHYTPEGKIKAEYDLKHGITNQYNSNGFIKEKSITKRNVIEILQYSDKINGLLKYKDVTTRNDTLEKTIAYRYYDNGNLEKRYVLIAIKNSKSNYFENPRTTNYEEYYENGKLHVQGKYNQNRRVGIWKWYYENGEFNTQFDYKDGSGGQ